ncbi:uncharacterized protein [Onthophagus taurus]|uniref:uncharacterized protein n=1 Tax=Onthophagus taurus TaxID=166361 RepID=UPI000C2044A6|nr:uncharacterized protein LOC111425963 [Onthophagus taurus]
MFGYVYTILLISSVFISCSGECVIPEILRGSWFSWESRNVITELDSNSLNNGQGYCEFIKNDFNQNYTIVFKQGSCYSCMKFLVRTVNILEKIQTACSTVPDHLVSLDYICKDLRENQQFITLFLDHYAPVNCRSSFEGLYNFGYQNTFKFTGECRHPDALIKSCQTPGSQFLIANQKFNITYRQCKGMTGTFDGVVEYACLGDWIVGKNHYFAVANTKESRQDEKYRCFLKNRDDDLYLGVSITAECNTLKTVEKSPERLRVTPVKSEIVYPGCEFPSNFTGEWINTANIDADVVINKTHIIETSYPDEGRFRRTIYICQQRRDTRVMMARLTVEGCQKDFVCFDFLPRHHNVIRYRKGIPVIIQDFSTVCSWVQFKNKIRWNYSLFLAKYPVAVRCPIAGKFNFTQKGEAPFETRIMGGVTKSPRPTTYCKQNISDFSVCDSEQKTIAIDENYCLSVDYLGRPTDIYSDPDYTMKCIGFWKENLKSYLITYDELDPFSKYRCWVYQRADLNRVLMSQGIGPYCDLNQEVQSFNNSEGAAVALDMHEYERERDQCPLHFDDGSDPWSDTESTKMVVFKFLRSNSIQFKPLVLIYPCSILLTLLRT